MQRGPKALRKSIERMYKLGWHMLLSLQELNCIGRFAIFFTILIFFFPFHSKLFCLYDKTFLFIFHFSMYLTPFTSFIIAIFPNFRFSETFLLPPSPFPLTSLPNYALLPDVVARVTASCTWQTREYFPQAICKLPGWAGQWLGAGWLVGCRARVRGR